MGNLNIDVLGTNFSIKASEDEEYLNKLLGYYKQIVEEIEKSGMMKDKMHVSILAGIMLCDELYKEKSKNARLAQGTSPSVPSEQDAEAERHTLQMIKRLDQAISGFSGIQN